jgi:hypothetical protein
MTKSKKPKRVSWKDKFEKLEVDYNTLRDNYTKALEERERMGKVDPANSLATTEAMEYAVRWAKKDGGRYSLDYAADLTLAMRAIELMRLRLDYLRKQNEQLSGLMVKCGSDEFSSFYGIAVGQVVREMRNAYAEWRKACHMLGELRGRGVTHEHEEELRNMVASPVRIFSLAG